MLTRILASDSSPRSHLIACVTAPAQQTQIDAINRTRNSRCMPCLPWAHYPLCTRTSCSHLTCSSSIQASSCCIAACQKACAAHTNRGDDVDDACRPNSSSGIPEADGSHMESARSNGAACAMCDKHRSRICAAIMACLT